MKDVRVMWEDVVWMHAGAGADGYQEERVPELESFEHSFPVGGVLNGVF